VQLAETLDYFETAEFREFRIKNTRIRRSCRKCQKTVIKWYPKEKRIFKGRY